MLILILIGGIKSGNYGMLLTNIVQYSILVFFLTTVKLLWHVATNKRLI